MARRALFAAIAVVAVLAVVALPAAAQPPVNLMPPPIIGELVEGEFVVALTGSWLNSPTMFGNQWERCDSRRCVPTEELRFPAVGYPSPFLRRLVAADVGMRLRANVTAANAFGSQSAFSEQSDVVRARNPPPLERLKPFPVVGVRGFSTRRGARLTRLSVSGPRGAAVRITCRGRGCPYRTSRARLADGPLVVKRLVGPMLAVGTVIEVRVTGRGRIGKYTRFRVVRNARPARVDRCLVPGRPDPSACAPAESSRARAAPGRPAGGASWSRAGR